MCPKEEILKLSTDSLGIQDSRDQFKHNRYKEVSGQRDETIHRKISGIHNFQQLSNSGTWKSKFGSTLKGWIEYKRYNILG